MRKCACARAFVVACTGLCTCMRGHGCAYMGGCGYEFGYWVGGCACACGYGMTLIYKHLIYDNLSSVYLTFKDLIKDVRIGK